eukprot:RCo039440
MPGVRGIGDDPQVQYIRSEKLYKHVDLLVNRFLTKQPSSPGRYFDRFMVILDDPEDSVETSGSPSQPRTPMPLLNGNSRPEISSGCPGCPNTSRPLNTSTGGLSGYFGTVYSRDTVKGEYKFKLLYEIPEKDWMKEIFAYLKRGELNEDCFGAPEKDKDPEAHEFRDFKIKVEHREFDLRGVGAPPKCFPVPCELRLGHLFLWELGIDLNLPDLIPGNTDKVAPLPCVRFRSQLDAKRTSQVVISAEKLESYLMHRFGSGKLEKWKGKMDVDDLSEVFGEKVFMVDMEELKLLAKYTRVFTAVLPRKFFLKMVSIVSRDELVKWYYEHKEVALREMGEGPDLCELGKLIRDLTDKPELRAEYGFPLKTYWTNVSRQSLAELSTQVCVACMGYLFTGYNNQIAPRT